ncbi:MOSC domain-containing protein [Paenibacillus cisolokensis]|uniref:MOSC domain-containing protein n=1 Tax=Paenibacillus cisolokensis TaxID=1658519 RepID=UPI003D2C7C0D
MTIEIVSVNIGKPQQVQYRGRELSTGIWKTPVEGPLHLSYSNLEGDGQADLVHHGGRDKALCVYAYEHYPFWERELKRPLAYGAFGENLTVRGLPETEVCIGDIFRFGEAVVQVSQPRQPCFKLAVKYGVPELPVKVQETGFTGYYFRVLQEGEVSPKDGLIRVFRHPKAVTVSFANRIMHHDKQNAEGIQRILDVEELSGSWQETLRKRLAGIGNDAPH